MREALEKKRKAKRRDKTKELAERKARVKALEVLHSEPRQRGEKPTHAPVSIALQESRRAERRRVEARKAARRAKEEARRRAEQAAEEAAKEAARLKEERQQERRQVQSAAAELVRGGASGIPSEPGHRLAKAATVAVASVAAEHGTTVPTPQHSDAADNIVLQVGAHTSASLPSLCSTCMS